MSHSRKKAGRWDMEDDDEEEGEYDDDY